VSQPLVRGGGSPADRELQDSGILQATLCIAESQPNNWRAFDHAPS